MLSFLRDEYDLKCPLRGKGTHDRPGRQIKNSQLIEIGDRSDCVRSSDRTQEDLHSRPVSVRGVVCRDL
jgi:hypothetical protein